MCECLHMSNAYSCPYGDTRVLLLLLLFFFSNMVWKSSLDTKNSSFWYTPHRKMHMRDNRYILLYTCVHIHIHRCITSVFPYLEFGDLLCLTPTSVSPCNARVCVNLIIAGIKIIFGELQIICQLIRLGCCSRIIHELVF